MILVVITRYMKLQLAGIRARKHDREELEAMRFTPSIITVYIKRAVFENAGGLANDSNNHRFV